MAKNFSSARTAKSAQKQLKYKIHLSVYITWDINFAPLLLFVTEFVLKHLEEIRSALCNVFQVAKPSS